jgi:hypothetical protein
MPSLFAACLRILLTVALIANPVAGAARAQVVPTPERVAAAAKSAKMSMPCAEMMAAAKHGSDAGLPVEGSKLPKAPDHGCGCGDAACQFAACCAMGALGMPSSLQLADLGHGGQAVRGRNHAFAPAPPPARMIRPPIA